MNVKESKKDKSIRTLKRESKAARRKSLRPLCYPLKVDDTWINKPAQALLKQKLNGIFYEAKLYYNYILSWSDLDRENNKISAFDISAKADTSKVIERIAPIEGSERYIVTKGGNKKRIVDLQKVPYTFKYLNKMTGYRIGIQQDALNSIKGLSASKKKGRFVGKLKYKKEVSSISIRSGEVHPTTKRQQLNTIKPFGNSNTWMKPVITTVSTDTAIAWIKGEDSKFIQIGGIGRLKVNGIKQIPNGAEINDAKLVRSKAGDFYINLNASIPYDQTIPENGINSAVGIDMGIQTTLTTSDGDTINVFIPETPRFKKLQRMLSHKDEVYKHKGIFKKSNRYWRIKKKLEKEREKILNRKDEKCNQVVNSLYKKYDKVVIQDELLRAWHASGYKGMGRKVQHSILGRFKQSLRLKEKNNKAVIIKSSHATTQLCYSCGKKNRITLDNRIYTCSCGYTENRDINAAKIILKIGLDISR